MFAPRAPTRSGSNLFVRLRRSFGLRPHLRAVARRLRTRSIARSLARTIVTCSKSALPLALAPQLVGAEVAHVQTGLRPAGVVATSSSPTQVPTAEALENQGGPPTWFSSAEAASPSLSTAVLSGKDGWRHLGRAVRPDKLGGYFVVLQGLLSACAGTARTNRRTGACTRDFSLSDACSDTAYRDACSIDRCVHQLMSPSYCIESHSVILRHVYQCRQGGWSLLLI